MKFSMGGPERWFGHVKGEFELLRAYVTNVENQLEMGLINFVKSFNEEVIEYEGASGTREHIHHRLVYDGLDDSTWAIADIFDNYFPSLHRRSCFITIYSFVEHNLEGLCKRYTRTLALEITVQDLKGSGIERSKLYLQKVIELDLSNAEKAWGKVKELQKIRNWVVHNDGRISDSSHADIVKRISYVHLQGDELILTKSFLEYALTCFEDFCRAVHKSVKAQNDESKPTRPPTS